VFYWFEWGNKMKDKIFTKIIKYNFINSLISPYNPILLIFVCFFSGMFIAFLFISVWEHFLNMQHIFLSLLGIIGLLSIIFIDYQVNKEVYWKEKK
jgi:hypothetical protein